MRYGSVDHCNLDVQCSITHAIIAYPPSTLNPDKPPDGIEISAKTPHQVVALIYGTPTIFSGRHVPCLDGYEYLRIT